VASIYLVNQKYYLLNTMIAQVEFSKSPEARKKSRHGASRWKLYRLLRLDRPLKSQQMRPPSQRTNPKNQLCFRLGFSVQSPTFHQLGLFNEDLIVAGLWANSKANCV
jgi:hypothetical protein